MTTEKTLTLKRFRDFIHEDEARKRSTLVFALGRFQPPTRGHEALIKRVSDVARAKEAFPQIFVSLSHDKAKNPLTFTERQFFMKKMFKKILISPCPDVNEKDRKISGIMAILFSEQKFYKNVVIVCGSDRIEELRKKVSAQNNKLYTYESIEFISSGDRDPDADDDSVESISGTKMRAAARNMDFAKFRAGIPLALSDNDTRDLMMTIRHSISVRESFDLKTPQLLPSHTRKAVFLIGVPGSGKDFVLDKVLSQHGLKEVSSHNKIDMNDVKNGMSLLVNVNADDFDAVVLEKNLLELENYTCKAIFVSASNNVSKKRNLERESRGGRVTTESIREEKWQESMRNLKKFEGLFKSENFIEFDNSTDLRVAAEVTRKRKASELLQIFNEIRKFVGATVVEDINILFEQSLLNDKTKNNKIVTVVNKKKNLTQKKTHGKKQQEKQHS